MDLKSSEVMRVDEDDMTWIEWLKPGALPARSFLFPDVTQVQIHLGKQKGYSEHINYLICGSFDKDVHLLRDVGSNTQHVLKTIARKDFRMQEVVAMRQMNKQTNLVPLLKMVRQDEVVVHLHMEYLEGWTLTEAIVNINRSKHAESPVRFLLAVMLTKDLLETIEKLHDLGYIHGDIHGGNIMLVRELNCVCPKVLDFGSVEEKDSNQHTDILKTLIMMCWMMGIGASQFSGPERLMWNWRKKLADTTIDDEWKDFLIKVFKEAEIDDFLTCGGVLAMLDEKLEEVPELTNSVKEKGWKYLFTSREENPFIQQDQQQAAGDMA